MNVRWGSRAWARWQEVGEYILARDGVRSYEAFVDNTDEWVQILKRMPEVGQLEPLLRSRSITYRSIVIGKLNKLIYYVANDTVYIADLWDTRREPLRQARETE